MRKFMERALCMVALTVSVASAAEGGSVTIGRYTYLCQTSCVVETRTDGRLQVRDAKGGFVRQYTANESLPIGD